MRAFAAAFRAHLRNTAARPMFQVVILAQPVVTGTVAWFVYREAGIPQAAAFAVLGSGLAGVWSAATFSSAGDMDRERWAGTLQLAFASPTPVWLLASARAAAVMVLSVSALAVGVGYATLVLRVPFDLQTPPAFWLALLLFLVGTNLFALSLANLFLISRRTAILQNFLEWPLLLVTGILFPLSAVPGWAGAVGALLPMRWAAEAVLSSAQGLPAGRALALAAAAAAGWYLIALLLFPVVERRVRRSASLELA